MDQGIKEQLESIGAAIQRCIERVDALSQAKPHIEVKPKIVPDRGHLSRETIHLLESVHNSGDIVDYDKFRELAQEAKIERFGLLFAKSMRVLTMVNVAGQRKVALTSEGAQRLRGQHNGH